MGLSLIMLPVTLTNYTHDEHLLILVGITCSTTSCSTTSTVAATDLWDRVPMLGTAAVNDTEDHACPTDPR